MLHLMTFEALSLRSHAPYFLIEYINLAIECGLLRLLCIIAAYLVQGLLDGKFVDFSHYARPVEDETTSHNICTPDSSQGHSFYIIFAGV